MPGHRQIVFAFAVVLSLTWALPPVGAQPLYSVRTLASQIPPGDFTVAAAATSVPGGVEMVGVRHFHNGGFDRTPLRFPTSTSNAQLMNNPPSGSTQGYISAVTYSPSLGVLEAGQYDHFVGSTGEIHAVVWNGTPNSGVDLHIASNTIASDSVAYAVSPAPIGFQAAGLVVQSGDDHAAMWRGATPQASQVILLHNLSAMYQSRAYGAYTFNGVARQVGYSVDYVPGGGTTQPRARVWSGSAASAIDLTPSGFLYGVIKGGNGDGPSEILYGHIGTTINDERPTIWTGLSGAFRILDTTAAAPAGDIVFCTPTIGVGHLGGGMAAIWDLASGHVTNLHSFLPPELQTGPSEAFYVDALGNVYGQASMSGGTLGVPVVWTPIPEPSSLTLSTALALFFWARRRVRWRQPDADRNVLSPQRNRTALRQTLSVLISLD
jgi:hypothetical protein